MDVISVENFMDCEENDGVAQNCFGGLKSVIEN
jgi:hypothetical protein